MVTSLIFEQIYNMTTRYLSLLLLCVILVYACKKTKLDRDLSQPPVYEVPEEFQAYVDSFVAAGEQRGDTILIDNLIIDWEQDNEDIGTHTCAVCVKARNNERSDTLQKYIIVRQDCWDSRNKYSKEVVIFHELGHCYLNRNKHTTETMTGGFIKSIMHESIVDTIWGDSTLYRRAYYLDELFNSSTPEPYWAE